MKHTLYCCCQVSLSTLLIYLATFLVADAATVRLGRPALGFPLREPYATCITTPPVHYPGLPRFVDDCIGAWRTILSEEPFSSTRWRWKRFSPDEDKPKGYESLPFEQVYRYCTISLDVLGRESTEDVLAIDSVGASLRTIFDECITPHAGRAGAGFIAVGKYQRLKLAVGPSWTPGKSWKTTASNGTIQDRA